MDFVEWVSVVLDRLAAAVRANPSLRVNGFGHDQAARFVWDDLVDIDPDFAASTRAAAVKDGISALLGKGFLREKDPVMGPYDIYLLSDKGRRGAKELEASWGIIAADELDDEKKSLLEFVNTQSERTDADHSWLAYIPISEVVAAMGWDGGAELVTIVAKQMEPSHFDPYLLSGRLSNDVVSMRAAYKGLVWSTRRSAADPIHAMFKNLDRAAAAFAVSDEAHDLSFMQNTELRGIVEADCREAAACRAAHSWKAAALLFASVLEGMLFDALHWQSTMVLPDYVDLPTMVGKNKKKGDAIDWDKIGIADAADMCHKLGLIEEMTRRMLGNARDWRDTIHPNNERNLGDRAGEDDVVHIVAMLDRLQAALLQAARRSASP